jgi:hypothetical protein
LARELNGLIQHSFALRVPPELRPAYAGESIGDAARLLQAIFAPAGCGFELSSAGMTPGGPDAPWWHRSPLLAHEQTTIQPRRLPVAEPAGSELTGPLKWANEGCGKRLSRPDWQGLVIAGADRPGETRQKDFLLAPPGPEGEDNGSRTSQVLTQLLAHRRSRLFGLPLARETINVLPPHARLRSTNDPGKDWFAQPALSLFYVYGRRSFRPIFSFSLLLVPCTVERQGGSSVPILSARPMSPTEIRNSVRNPWPLATALRENRPEAFEVSGPLGEYLSAVAPRALSAVGIDAGDSEWAERGREGAAHSRLTVRSVTETTLFALALRMARPSHGLLPPEGRKEVGDRVMTSLSASRVSAVALVADNCAAASEAGKKDPSECRPLRPFDLSNLLRDISTEISDPYRFPRSMREEQREGRRLDRDFFDTASYAMGVLPADRCVVSVGDGCAQKGFRSSALLEAAWTAYMVSGAAVATGMIRNVFRDIARVERSKPDLIADLEREAMVDLHETYDLEITTEVYRSRYRLLREHLGIDAEYKALSDKLEALYRETSTRFEGRSERRLTVLTWAIVILSAVIAAGTLVLIFKPGG